MLEVLVEFITNFSKSSGTKSVEKKYLSLFLRKIVHVGGKGFQHFPALIRGWVSTTTRMLNHWSMRCGDFHDINGYRSNSIICFKTP